MAGQGAVHEHDVLREVDVGGGGPVAETERNQLWVQLLVLAKGVGRMFSEHRREDLGVAAHELQPVDVARTQPEHALVRAHVVERDLGGVVARGAGQEAVELGDDARRVGLPVELEQALAAEPVREPIAPLGLCGVGRQSGLDPLPVADVERGLARLAL